jgi:serine protease Do
VFEITLATATTIQIDMTSDDVDSYIGLFESNGVFIGEDDNSGGGRNSQLVKQLAAGKYRIWANTITGGATGAYSIVVTPRASSAGFSDRPTPRPGRFRN